VPDNYSDANAETLPWDRFAESQPLNPGACHTHPVCVIGSGLAGCWSARLLAEQGIRVRLFEQHRSIASAASGNPVGMSKPFVTRTQSFAMSFYLKAHEYLLEQLQALDLREACAHTPCGVAQLVEKPYPASEHYCCLDEADTTKQVGTAVHSHSIYFAKAGWLNPAALCRALVKHPLISVRTNTTIEAIKSAAKNSDTRWRLHTTQQSIDCNHVILASGVALDQHELTTDLPITPARGQISRFPCCKQDLPRCIVSGKHYVIAHGNSVLVGATFERGSYDESIRHTDHQTNFDGLQRQLPQFEVDVGQQRSTQQYSHDYTHQSLQQNAKESWQEIADDSAFEGYAGVRATTPDRLPLVGPIADHHRCQIAYADLHHGRNTKHYLTLPIHEGLYALGGLGSRGITTAPLSAALLVKHLVPSTIMDESLGSLTYWAPLLNPARFHIRRLKRKIR